MGYLKQETLVYEWEEEDYKVVMPRLHAAGTAVTPWICEQLPGLPILHKGASPLEWREWLSSAEGKLGNKVALRPLPMSKVGWQPTKEDWDAILNPVGAPVERQHK
jgi:hypothetical protein